MARVIVPASYFKVQKERVNKTRHIMDPVSGQMMGRKIVPTQRSDRTQVLRMSKDFDVNKDRKIDDRDLRAGEIIGRASFLSAKPKQVEVQRHWRKSGEEVRKHSRTR
jgi:hypothetical protein